MQTNVPIKIALASARCKKKNQWDILIKVFSILQQQNILDILVSLFAQGSKVFIENRVMGQFDLRLLEVNLNKKTLNKRINRINHFNSFIFFVFTYSFFFI